MKELYGVAQDLEIAGRSAMSSEELRSAVRAAHLEQGTTERAS